MNAGSSVPRGPNPFYAPAAATAEAAVARENCRYTTGFGPAGKRNGRKHPEMPAIDRDLETLAVERDPDGFVRLTVTVPGHRQNVLTRRVVEELSRVLDQLADERPRGVILLSGRIGSFFAGADVSRLEELGRLSTAEIADLFEGR